MGGVQQFTLRSGQPEAEVALGDVPATVSVTGGTVYYRDEPGVTSAVNDGSIASGSSASLSGTQFFSTTASRADVTVVQSGVVSVRVVDERLSFTDPRIGGQAADANVDNGPKFATAYALMPYGGELFFPAGGGRAYGCATTPADVPGGVWLTGTGYDYHTPSSSSDRPVRHSVIRATAVMTQLLQLGSGNANAFSSGSTGASLKSIVVDGNNLAGTVVKTVARRNRIMESQIQDGTTQALYIAGQNNVVVGSVIAQPSVGDVINVDTYYDNKIWQNQIRGPGPAGAAIRVRGSSQNDIEMNHIFAGANGVAAAAQALIVLDAFDVNNSVVQTRIASNTIEGVIGPQILLITGGSGAVIRNLAISNNRMYQPSPTGFVDATWPAIQVSAVSGAFISTVDVSANVIQGADSTHRYKSLIDWGTTQLGSNERWIFDANNGTYLVNIESGTAPFNTPFWGRNAITDATNTIRSQNQGTSTQSGTGAQTSFVFAHGLDNVPRYATVTPGSAAANGSFHVTYDSTNLTVVFAVAPANGSNNVLLRWRAGR